MRRAAALLLGLCLLGCPKPEPASASAWDVYKGDRLVLAVDDGPGPTVSTAAPPPGAPPVRHPFLSASAHAAEEEDALKGILDASESTADFLARLEKAGYDVRPRVH